MPRFYITTPIYYVNDKPHVGTAYSTTIADILARYQHFFGNSTFFLTGLDEHGQKCQQAAEHKNLSPQDHCDQMAKIFQKYWKALGFQYNRFYRTSSVSHIQKVQQALQKLYDSNHIYSDTYEGWYCVSEEIFYPEKDLVDGLSPTGKKVTKIKEKNYFFRMSRFQDRLIQYIQDHPDFIYPENYKNEVLGFLNNKLEDLCISRPKSRLKWGVPLPFDSDYVVYVWVDALMNYIFGIEGLWEENQKSTFDPWWAEARHLIGKDILITHCVYWPCLLMALDLPMPQHIFAHGWLLNKEQEKMSKSKGETLDPIELAEKISSDSLKYFFAKAVRFGQDAPISQELIIKEHNQDLANNLGNLFQRAVALVHSHFEGKIPIKPEPLHPLQKQALDFCESFKSHIQTISLHTALSELMDLLSRVNKFLEEEEPWKKIHSDRESTAHTLYIVLDVVRISAGLLQPVLPQGAAEILKRMGLDFQPFTAVKQPDRLLAGQALIKGKAIFPRIH